MRLPAHIVEERDARIFAAKNRGMTYREIANAMDISVGTAHKGFLRQQERVAKMAMEDSINGVWSHLEKLDALERPLWPLTKERIVEIEGPDGEPIKVPVPPDLGAIAQINKLMQQRARIMGWDKEVVVMQTPGGSGPAINAAQNSGEQNAEQLAKELAREMLSANVVDGPMKELIQSALQLENSDDTIVDAEIVDEYQFALKPGNTDDSPLPPAWIDDDDDDEGPGYWVPDDMEDGDTDYGGR